MTRSRQAEETEKTADHITFPLRPGHIPLATSPSSTDSPGRKTQEEACEDQETNETSSKDTVMSQGRRTKVDERAAKNGRGGMDHIIEHGSNGNQVGCRRRKLVLVRRSKGLPKITQDFQEQLQRVRQQLKQATLEHTTAGPEIIEHHSSELEKFSSKKTLPSHLKLSRFATRDKTREADVLEENYSGFGNHDVEFRSHQLGKQEKALQKWERWQKEWKKVTDELLAIAEQGGSRARSGNMPRSLMRRSECYRQKVERADLEVFQQSKYRTLSVAQWPAMLRANNTRYVSVGNVFSGLYCKIRDKKPEQLEIVRRNATILGDGIGHEIEDMETNTLSGTRRKAMDVALSAMERRRSHGHQRTTISQANADKICVTGRSWLLPKSEASGQLSSDVKYDQFSMDCAASEVGDLVLAEARKTHCASTGLEAEYFPERFGPQLDLSVNGQMVTQQNLEANLGSHRLGACIFVSLCHAVNSFPKSESSTKDLAELDSGQVTLTNIGNVDLSFQLRRDVTGSDDLVFNGEKRTLVPVTVSERQGRVLPGSSKTVCFSVNATALERLEAMNGIFTTDYVFQINPIPRLLRRLAAIQHQDEDAASTTPEEPSAEEADSPKRVLLPVRVTVVLSEHGPVKGYGSALHKQHQRFVQSKMAAVILTGVVREIVDDAIVVTKIRAEFASEDLLIDLATMIFTLKSVLDHSRCDRVTSMRSLDSNDSEGGDLNPMDWSELIVRLQATRHTADRNSLVTDVLSLEASKFQVTRLLSDSSPETFNRNLLSYMEQLRSSVYVHRCSHLRLLLASLCSDVDVFGAAWCFDFLSWKLSRLLAYDAQRYYIENSLPMKRADFRSERIRQTISDIADLIASKIGSDIREETMSKAAPVKKGKRKKKGKQQNGSSNTVEDRISEISRTWVEHLERCLTESLVMKAEERASVRCSSQAGDVGWALKGCQQWSVGTMSESALWTVRLSSNSAKSPSLSNQAGSLQLEKGVMTSSKPGKTGKRPKPLLYHIHISSSLLHSIESDDKLSRAYVFCSGLVLSLVSSVAVGSSDTSEPLLHTESSEIAHSNSGLRRILDAATSLLSAINDREVDSSICVAVPNSVGLDPVERFADILDRLSDFAVSYVPGTGDSEHLIILATRETGLEGLQLDAVLRSADRDTVVLTLEISEAVNELWHLCSTNAKDATGDELVKRRGASTVLLPGVVACFFQALPMILFGPKTLVINYSDLVYDVKSSNAGKQGLCDEIRYLIETGSVSELAINFLCTDPTLQEPCVCEETEKCAFDYLSLKLFYDRYHNKYYSLPPTEKKRLLFNFQAFECLRSPSSLSYIETKVQVLKQLTAKEGVHLSLIRNMALPENGPTGKLVLFIPLQLTTRTMQWVQQLDEAVARSETTASWFSYCLLKPVQDPRSTETHPRRCTPETLSQEQQVTLNSYKEYGQLFHEFAGFTSVREVS